jgi:hypothetical protein
MVFFAVITDLTYVLRYHLNLPSNINKALAIGWFTVASRHTVRNKELFILQCCDTFRVLGRKKQHFIANVTVSFVSSVDLFLGEVQWSVVASVCVCTYRVLLL